MVFISRDGLKAIYADLIDFFTILPERNADGKFRLLAKTPTQNDFYEFLILFEHEDIDVVKRVMRFLANGQFFFPVDDNSDLIVVDLPDLYKHGLCLRD